MLLATALVNVQIGLTLHSCRALCDSGAQMNLISAKCAQRIGAREFPCDRLVRTGSVLNKRVFLDIRAQNVDQFIVTAEFTVINELMGELPHEKLPAVRMPIDVVLADSGYNMPNRIDLLFGAGIWAGIVGPTIYRNPLGTVLQETAFGYIVLGIYEVGPEDTAFLSLFHVVGQMPEIPQPNQAVEEVTRILKRFWEIQELSDKRLRSPQEDLVERIFVEKHRRHGDGRYIVDIPIVPGSELLGESRAIALKRFMWLERRLQRNPELRQQYVEFMQEYEQLGHMQLATESPRQGEQVYYIPHHCVISKFRVVFDGSCKTTSGKSFNDIQMVGEKLQHDLADVIVRFRRHKIALSADVKKMFRQVKVNPDQWNCQRILWREHETQPLREYWLTVVTYGLSSSVHSSVRAMKQCAIDHNDEWPKAAQVVHDDFYVDDCFTGQDEVPDASTLRQDLSALLQKGGFELAKWASNNPAVLESVPAIEDIVELGEEADAKVLGLRWLTASDELTFRVMK